jgi:hypothetical protein
VGIFWLALATGFAYGGVMSFPPVVPPPVRDAYSGKATAGLVLGILGMILWLIPILGMPVLITGLVLSVRSLNSTKRSKALAGMILCILGLVLCVANAAVGAYLGATGQLFRP